MAALGERIRQLREVRGIKQAALARHLGIPMTTMSHYESGPNRIPADLIPRIAVALDLSVCELYGVEEGHENRRPVFERLAAELATILASQPERIEINVYGREDSGTRPAASRGRNQDDELAPAPGLRFMRAFLAGGGWSEISEEERREWRELAEQIRREKGDPDGPRARVRGGGTP